MGENDRATTSDWLFLVVSVFGLAMVVPALASAPTWWNVITAIALGLLALVIAVRITASAVAARRRRAQR